MEEVEEKEEDNQGGFEDPIPGAVVHLGHRHPSPRFSGSVARAEQKQPGCHFCQQIVIPKKLERFFQQAISVVKRNSF